MANGSSSIVNNKCRHHDVFNVLTNFLILSDILLFKYFSLYGYFEGNSDNAMNSTIWRHNDNITSLCRSSYALLLEMMSSLCCV